MFRIRVALAGHSWSGAAQDWGPCPGWRVNTGCVVLLPVRAGQADATFPLKHPSIHALAELPNKWVKVPGKFSLK